MRTSHSTTRRQFLRAATSAAVFRVQNTGPSEGMRTRAEWAEWRENVLANMQLVMGPLPKKRELPLDIIESEKVEQPRFTRIKISFLGGDEDHVPAYLLMPKGLRRRAPALLCLHQTIRIGKAEPAGLGGNPNLHYAKELAELGYISLAPDYPDFGEYQFDPYQHNYASTTMKAIRNHMRAIDVLRSLPDVAPNRIGAVGHSLGGHNALFAAAFDQRIRAIVTSCGFNSFKKYYGGDLTGWTSKKYMPLIAEKYGKNPDRMPFDFPQVLAALAPRPLFINAPLRDSNFEVSGVKDCVDAAMPIYSRIFNAGDRLVAVYPDTGHEFPPPIRQKAYEFLNRWLK